MTYDSLGRMKKAIAPDYTLTDGSDGSTTETFYNETTRPPGASTAPGETRRVKDAWGRERWGLTDAQGRLIQIAEPNPSGSGSVFDAGALLTSYAYDMLGKPTLITQGVQSRSFKYDSLGRLIAQKLAETSATLNSSGTYVGAGGQWSDYFRYENTRSNVVQHIDARGVKANFWYFNSAGHSDPGDGTEPDPLNRLQSVSYDTTAEPNHGVQPGDPNYYLRVLEAATASYQYRQKTAGQPNQLRDVMQLEKVTTSGVSSETYGFDDFDRVNKKTLKLDSRPLYPMIADYTYDSLDRVTHVYYPGKDLFNNSGRKHIQPYYDIASRLTRLTVDNNDYASGISYNPGSQTAKLKVGASGANQITENYEYDPQTGLLSSQTVVRGADITQPPPTTLLNLQYQYTDANGKRTGQLTKLLDNRNHNKDRSYTYDALGRLSLAKGGVNGALWSQTYAYDRYGNRLSVTPNGYSAKSGVLSEPGAVATGSSPIASPSDPRVDLPTDLIAKNNTIELPESLRDKDSRSISDSPTGLYSGKTSRGSSPTVSEGAGASKARATSPPQGPTNLALNKPATESSIHNGDRWASRAVDGNTNGALWSGSASATNYEYQPWWQVDLGSSQSIGPIEVWGRTDCCPEMTSNYYVLISDQPFVSNDLATARAQAGVSSYYVPGYSGTPGTLNINRTGRYVRVQLASWQYLVLAEVKVLQATGSAAIPTDGISSLSYDSATNRITTSGFAYDVAGNQIRAIASYGGSQTFQYDAENRLVNVRTDANVLIATYTYGDDRERLTADESGMRTYYAGGTCEYIESGSSTAPTWSKSYIHLGNRLLATLEPNGSGGEYVQFHHPDRLGASCHECSRHQLFRAANVALWHRA